MKRNLSVANLVSDWLTSLGHQSTIAHAAVRALDLINICVTSIVPQNFNSSPIYTYILNNPKASCHIPTMPSVISIVASLLFIYIASLVYRLVANISHGSASGLPYIIIPWDQNHFLWMITSVPLRPILKKYLPKWIYDRLSLTIYGFEFHERLRPYEQIGAPYGNDKSYAIATPGRFEVETRDPEITTEILRRPTDFMQVDLTELFMGRFGQNVLTSDGESWARQRKVVAGVINERISKTVFNESFHQTDGLLDEVLGDKKVGETNRIFDMMKKITINVLSGAGM